MTAPTSTPAAPAHVQRPRPAPGTEVHPPAGDGGPWLLQRGERYVRVGREVARLAGAMDGSDHETLSATLGRPWTADLVAQAVARLDALGLVDRGDMAPPRVAPRVKLIPPFTIQLTLLRPGRAMQRWSPVAGALANRLVIVAAVLVSLGGLAALAVQSRDVSRMLAEPLPLTAYLGLLVALVGATSLHELGHAATLMHYGGRPARMGVMLFYLLPALFCDVSDSWRLPRRGQRVRVALAGPAVQTFLAGAAALAALLTPPSGLRSGLLLFAVGCYLTGLLNLLPFVKLDGYLALMSHLDIPYLRNRAMTDARRLIARLLFGGRYQRELRPRWTTWYGLACLAFPVYLLSTALSLWIGLLQGGGFVGLVLLACGFAYALYFAGRGIARTGREVRAVGAPRWRVLLVSGALLGGLGAAAFAPTPYSVSGAFVSRDGATELVLLDGADTASLAAGQRVELATNGIVVQRRVGEATVAGRCERERTAPLSSFFPLRLDLDPQLPVTCFRLATERPPSGTSGSASVRVGSLPAWQAAYRSYVHPFLH